MLKNTMFSITALSTMALLLCITLAFPVFASPAISSNEKSSFEEYTNSDLYSRAEPIQQINPFPFQSRRGPSNPNYTLDVHYDKDQHVMKGSMKVEVTNNLSTTLDHIYFNVWPNAETFQENGGGITVENVQVNGNASEYRVEKTKLDIQQVQWKPHEKKTITMEFKVQIPKQKDRFGWYGDTVSLGNWFPILAVYDEEGWNLDPYYPYGEAFYSLSGNFDVTVTTHSSEVIAATGKQIGERKVEGDMATYRYKAFNVRDFAMEMDPNYHVTTATVNNVDINVYYTDKQEKYADDMLESGVDSIKLFSEKFGAYPWPELDIVSMEGWFGGMEYPQLVMMSLTDNRTSDWVKSVTAHEIGHQWYYGIIGNNEYDEPWLDESFASFAAALYDGDLESLHVPAPRPDYYHLSSPVSTFTDHADEGGINYYYYTIYDYGASTINDLRKKLGDETFYKSMQIYFQLKKFDVTTTKDFIDIMEVVSGEDLDAFFQQHRVYEQDQQ